MKKIIALTSVAVLLFNFASAQEMTKEEKKRLKEEVKAYMSDLAGYKAKMQDIRVTLDSNDAEIKRQKDDIAAASAQIAELDNKLTDYIKELERCNDSLANMRYRSGSGGDLTVYNDNTTPGAGKNTVTIGGKTFVSGSSSPGNRNSSSTSSSTSADAGNMSGNSSSAGESPDYVPGSVKSGTVFKVQFGLYKDFNITQYFQQPRYIGYEEENGMKRYVISDFSDEAVAMNFVEDVRRMGIKDAFVAKYIDGQRVYEWSKNPKYKGKPVPSSLEEALEMDRKSKKGKKNN